MLVLADRLRSSYGASSSGASSGSSRAYHYNVNTDWTHYESGSSGYTSRISKWSDECKCMLVVVVLQFAVAAHAVSTRTTENSVNSAACSVGQLHPKPCCAHMYVLSLLLVAGRWEWWKRAARHGVRNFGHTLHVSLAVLLVGGGLMFEYSHSALWAARNKGVSQC